jgi:hypothetical protein
LNQKIVIGLIIAAIVLVGGYFLYNRMNNTLPEEGRQALDKELQRFYNDHINEDGHFEYEITSSQKAKNINTFLYSAVYCVTISPPFEYGRFTEYYTNFFVYQKGNSWTVRSIYDATEEQFLEYECDNWVHERGDPYNARNNG